MSDYKAIFSNESFYEEVLFGDSHQANKKIRVGTGLGCTVRFHKEWFQEQFWVDFIGREGAWSVRCSDNLYFFTGDVRKLVRVALNEAETLSVRYANNNLDAFSIDVFYDYGIVTNDLRREIEVGYSNLLSFGTQIESDIVLRSEYLTNESLVLQRKGRHFIAFFKGNRGTFLINGNMAVNGDEIRDYDFFSIADILFYYKDGSIWTETGDKAISRTKSYIDNANRSGYPRFERSTRERRVLCEEGIEILDPPEKPQEPRNSILMSLLPSLGMIATSAMMATMGSQMMAYSLVSGGVAICMAFIGIYQSKKDYEEEVVDRRNKYFAYEEKKIKEILQARDREREEKEEIYLNIDEEKKLVRDYSPELFDRSAGDTDYLNIRIGTGEVPAARKIDYRKQERLETDDLFEIPEKIAKEYAMLANSPVVLDFRKNNVIGIVGRKENRYALLKNIIYDLSTRHFPTDYKLYLVIKPENYKKLAWMRFLPALNLKNASTRNIACDLESRNRVFDQLFKELSQREKEKEYNHIIVIFYDEYGFLSHPASVYMKDASDYKCTFLFMGDKKTNIPMHSDCTIYMNTLKDGFIVDTHDLNKRISFQIEPVEDAEASYMASTLAPVYTDEITLEKSLTKSLSLFQLFGIFSEEDIDLINRWKINSTEKSMAVPIGVTSSSIVYLDLHDKAHGPHGLVAGTTGSGKSELLQTYILSIAVNFHPNEVGFVIIDFKGGGMANQFRNLPHLLGTITNIDGKEVDRSLKFIKAELERRQRCFGEAGVNHIDKYIRAFKEGLVTEPLPHLVLIVDEFAELKAQQPDFMQELISAARIGRSLGVHLILATQKPAGQVDDQIWGNSRFKLCLKVQDQNDSNEVLKTPVAAEIKEPGRAYFQVGNNEIFELFQSAYSGASITQGVSRQRGFSIYEVSASGKRKPVFVQKEEEDSEKEMTQLEAVVNYIKRQFDENRMKKPSLVCLAPLPNFLAYDIGYKKAGENVCIGIYDDPEHQQQPFAMIDIENKNTFIIGSSQYGKTNLLMSMLRSIANTDSPEESVFYIMDFGSMILKQFEDLPHVGGIVTSAEDEKLGNLLKLLEEEIDVRKEKLLSSGVGSFKAYRKAGYSDLPHIYIMVDNMTAAMEMYFEDDDSLLRVIRDGLAYGISTIVTNMQTAGMSYRYLSNFANRISFYCNNGDEYMSLFDNKAEAPEELPGRCIFSVEKKIVECQTMLAFAGDREVERNNGIQQFCADIRRKHADSRIKHIPFIPAKLTGNMLIEGYNAKPERFRIPIGLTYKNIAPLYLDFAKAGVMGLCGDDPEERVHFLKKIFEFLQEQYDRNTELQNIRFIILDDVTHDLACLKNYSFVETYTQDHASIISQMPALRDHLDKQYHSMVVAGSFMPLELQVYIIQNNMFAQGIEENYEIREIFEEIVTKYRNMGCSFILSNYNNSSVPYDAPLPILKIKEDQNILYFGNLEYFKPFDLSYDVLRDNKRKRNQNDAYYIQGNDLERIKVIS